MDLWLSQLKLSCPLGQVENGFGYQKKNKELPKGKEQELVEFYKQIKKIDKKIISTFHERSLKTTEFK